MRVGLRLEGTSCRTVVLDGRTVVSAGQEVHAGSLPEALESSLSGLRREFGSGITEITVDVGRVLRERKLADVVAIRISPRPPADAFHMTVLPPLVEPAVTRTVHVVGGHDLRGRPLAPLDLEGFLADLPGLLSGGVRNVAITSVGSTASNDHETRIADAVLSNDRDMRISISSDFYSSVFRDRDYTAILNSALMQTGEELAVMLEGAGRRRLPAAVLSFAKNDGGRAPLSRLALAPVHGLRAEPAMGIVGAAALAGIPEGEVILCFEAGAMVGHIHGGLPVVRSLIRQGFDASLASNAAILEPYTAHHPVRADFPSVIADLRDSKDAALPFGLVPTLSAVQDAALVGSAAAPLTAWIDRLETVSGRVDLKRVQNLAEDDAHSAAVQLGATPGQTRIIESNVYAMPYGNPGIVRIRVQAAGETSADEEHLLPTAARGATQ